LAFVFHHVVFLARVRVACEAFRDPSVRRVEGVRSGGRAETERARHGLTDARVSGHERCSSSAERGTPRRSTRAVARSPLGTAESRKKRDTSRASEEGVRDRAGRREGTRTHLTGLHLSTHRVVRTAQGRG
jgi:hypothetical protein